MSDSEKSATQHSDDSRTRFEFEADRIVVSQESATKKVALSAMAIFHNEMEFAEAVRASVPRRYCLLGLRNMFRATSLAAILFSETEGRTEDVQELAHLGCVARGWFSHQSVA